MNIEPAQKLNKMNIIIGGSKGGNGKSTLTLSLFYILKDIFKEEVEIVDHDLQGTITKAAEFTNLQSPVKLNETKAKYILHDTPPYNSSSLLSIIKNSDLIIMPVKVSHADLMALKTIVENLRDMKITDKAVIVFNEVKNLIPAFIIK